MDLVKPGETAQIKILGEVFNVKVMSPFEAAEWSQRCTNGDNKKLIEQSLCRLSR